MQTLPPWERGEASPIPSHLTLRPPSSVPPDPLIAKTGLVGHSADMVNLRGAIARYASTTATVSIRGETGVGKELVARALHAFSPRSKRPFVATNVAALPESILQSELFGHERGAFTGANTRHKGLFEQAHGGTLFLDEIGETTPDVQANLLRAIESGEIRSVGSESTRAVDVRLVVATHRDLYALVMRGQFRADLFFRLHTLPLHVAPLRLRVEDLAVLTEHLLARMRSEVGARTVSPLGLHRLMTYGWPGNVRQLQSVLRRATVSTESPELDAETIQGALALEPAAPLHQTEAGQAATIEFALKISNGRIAAAARKLGMPRSTLRSHLKRFGIVPNTNE